MLTVRDGTETKYPSIVFLSIYSWEIPEFNMFDMCIGFSAIIKRAVTSAYSRIANNIIINPGANRLSRQSSVKSS